MSIEQSAIEAGWLYRTLSNQERVVIGCDSKYKVVYASRGGNVKNNYDHRESSTLEHFADACSEKVRKLSAEELRQIIVSCNAEGVVVSGNDCFLTNSSLSQ